jgi:hypothetical protein
MQPASHDTPPTVRYKPKSHHDVGPSPAGNRLPATHSTHLSPTACRVQRYARYTQRNNTTVHTTDNPNPSKLQLTNNRGRTEKQERHTLFTCTKRKHSGSDKRIEYLVKCTVMADVANIPVLEHDVPSAYTIVCDESEHICQQPHQKYSGAHSQPRRQPQQVQRALLVTSVMSVRGCLPVAATSPCRWS